VIIQKLLDFRLKLANVDGFLIPELHRRPQFRELLPVPIHCVGLGFVKHIEQLGYRSDLSVYGGSRQRARKCFRPGPELAV
jgi:hypothetical protein